ncbi:MAG: hypothetical protein WAN36_06225 [Calditrichia bacterium]
MDKILNGAVQPDFKSSLHLKRKTESDKMILIRVVIGAALLFLGRQLFWVFVGGIGFILGWEFATETFVAQPFWVLLLIAIAAGVIGAVLAVLLQRIAVGIAGFLAGAYLLLGIFRFLEISTVDIYWVIFFIGGIIGAVLVLLLFDWALIVLSSLAGAAIIVQTLAYLFTTGAAILLFIVLAVIGVAVQGAIYHRQKE